jgi:hypothetical protein
MKILMTILWISLILAAAFFEIFMVYKWGKRQMKREQDSNVFIKIIKKR